MERDLHATFLEYHGHAGATAPCVEAVERLLHSRRSFSSCLILTSLAGRHPVHALMLEDDVGNPILVKSGFASGYGGEGPKGLSATLALLNWHGVELDEVDVDKRLMDRLDASAMTTHDVATIADARRVRPQRLWDYVLPQDTTGPDASNPWSRRKLAVPLGVMDPRLAAMAREFWDDPDRVLTRAHRALEEAVKAKADVTQDEANGGPTKIFALAFNSSGRLHWPGIGTSEQIGRANLFVGTVTAYRNPRAHRELRDRPADALRELLLVNHLFCLEAEAVTRDLVDQPVGSS